MHPLALKRFCARVLQDLEQATHDSTRSLHQRYLQVYRLIRPRNLAMARLFDDPKCSRALSILAQMQVEGLLSNEEFTPRPDAARHFIERTGQNPTVART